MQNTRRMPNYTDTLVPSRQIMHEVSNRGDFMEARDAYEAALRNIDGWQTVPPHAERRLALSGAGKLSQQAEQGEDLRIWPRGINSEALFNMASAVGAAKTIEAIWFVASILQDNPSYFVFDTRKNIHDNSAAGMIARANGFCRFLGTPKGRIMRKYAGRSYLARY